MKCTSEHRARARLRFLPQAGVLLAALSLQIPPRAQARSAAGNTAPRAVTDEMGRRVLVPQTVRRIVSLAPSLTETLFALGLGDRIVGDTDFCDFPPEAKTKSHVGGPVNPNIETIAALHPDLVLVTRSINRLATVNSLEHLGIPVYATDPHSVEQVLASTQELARLLNAPGQGEALVAGLQRRLDALQRRLAGAEPKSVFFVVWQEPLITTGRNTFLSDALRRSGARSVVQASQDWPAISLEEVARLQPQYLIFANDDRAQADRQIDALREQPGWKELDALRESHVVVLGEAINEPSPRLFDAIEQLARALHPDRFPAGDSGSNRGSRRSGERWLAYPEPRGAAA